MQYREVIKPPVWLIAFLYFLVLSLVLSIWAALGNLAALLSLIFLTLALAYISFRARMKIEIVNGFLRVDKATIELKYLSRAQVLSSEQMKRIRTRDADPAAYLGIRFWESCGVQVGLNDSRDLTPYWVISSRRGDELTRALNKNL